MSAFKVTRIQYDYIGCVYKTTGLGIQEEK